MNKIIKVKVEDKIASLVDKSQFVVCGNTDYEIHFEFSEEWSNEFVKTALFVFGNTVIEKPFSGDICEGVEIVNASLCRIGVYAGNIKTTTPACLDCRKSITDAAGGKAHKDPSEDIYNQIIEVVNQGFDGLRMDVSDIFAQLGVIRDDISQNSQGIRDLNQVIMWMSGDIGANSSAISQNTKDIAEQTKRNDITDIRLANLEHHINPEYFYTDDGVAYQKVVPVSAAPYAQLNSIGGMTHKSNNLMPYPYAYSSYTINGVTFTASDDGIILVNGTASANAAMTLKNPLMLPKGKYSLSGAFDGAGIYLALYKGVQYVTEFSDRGKGVAFDTSSYDYDRTIVTLFVYSGTVANNRAIKPMLNYGTTALPYEPYYEGLRDAKVTAIRKYGANLTDGITIDPSAAINQEVYRELPLILGQGTYTISFSTVVYWQNHSSNITRNTGTTISNTFVFTVNDNAPAWVRFRDSASSSTPWDYSTKIMVNRGDKALPYSPYYEKTISLPTAIASLDGWGKGVDRYSNTYDFESGKYTRKAKEYTFTGDESWVFASADALEDYWRFYILKSSYTPDIITEGAENLMLCNMFDVKPWTSANTGNLASEFFWYAGASIGARVRKDRLPNYASLTDNASKVAAFREWLKNNPIIIVGILMASITEEIPVTFDNIIAVEGGGSLEFVNEYGYDAPSSITYLLQEGSV